MTNPTESSYFDGKAIQRIGWWLLSILLTAITLGLGYPWAMCMRMRWEVKHRVVSGRRMRFNGTGGQLFGKYLLWWLLTVITLGIYGFWFGLGMKKWKVKHTVFEDDPTGSESRFTGGAGGWIGHRLLAGLLTVVTLGIGAPWAQKMLIRWDTGHTQISGAALQFDGTGGQLFGNYLLLLLLTPLTLGVYPLVFPIRLLKWQYSHTCALEAPPVSPEAPVEPMAKKNAWVLPVVIVLAAALVVGGGILLWRGGVFQSHRDSNPDVVGLTEAQAMQELVRRGYSVEICYVDSPEGEALVQKVEYRGAHAVLFVRRIVETEESTEPPTEQTISLEEFTGILEGDWVTGQQNATDICLTFYHFEAGNMDLHDQEYHNIFLDDFQDPSADENGWYVAPKGYPSSVGPYTVTQEGNAFQITAHLYLDVADEYFDEAYTVTVEDADTLTVNGILWKRDIGAHDLNGHAALLGLDVTRPEPKRLLVGKWRSICYDTGDGDFKHYATEEALNADGLYLNGYGADRLWIYTYEFKDGGSAVYTRVTPSGSDERSGEWTMDGLRLHLHFPADSQHPEPLDSDYTCGFWDYTGDDYCLFLTSSTPTDGENPSGTYGPYNETP